jgi:hypothetical protein
MYTKYFFLNTTQTGFCDVAVNVLALQICIREDQG